MKFLARRLKCVFMLFERWRVRRKFKRFSQPYKLHVGCGHVRFAGWVNVDADSSLDAVDVFWDITAGIPVDDGTCRFVYSEHLLEHLTAKQGVDFLRECHRVLAPDGVLRVAMPSLGYLIDKSCDMNWKDQDWLKWPEYSFIQTRAEMLNIAFRSWGHQWLYDGEELGRRLGEAGFKKYREVEWRKSDIEELRNRETRLDSLLVFEATKEAISGVPGR